ncbi:MAG TPA: hypothetical protein VFT65_19610 [Candidatus Angelobacter sp.]|nr:hypothetical protein [Candidatus Angelobacter sp.]
MKSIRAVLFSGTVILGLSAFAFQNPAASQPSQQPQGGMQPGQPSQTQPMQNPGAVQPGAASQQPSMQQPSQTQAPQTSAQPGPSIDEQVKVLAEQLNLNADQQAKVKSALEDQHSQAMAVVADNTLARDAKIQKIHAIREGTITKVRGTLSSDDQKKKFDQMVQAQDDRMRQQQK